jgi:hypothetical protein
MQNEKDKKNVEESNDWAVLPFDEAEDDSRWEKLIEETDVLIKTVEEMEAVHGPLLTENNLEEIKTSEQQPEDELF